MKYSHNRKKIIAYVFASIIILSSTISLTADIIEQGNHLSLDKKDSTKVDMTSSMKENESKRENQKRVGSRSTGELSYNFVYFLVSKIVQITTISRPK